MSAMRRDGMRTGLIGVALVVGCATGATPRETAPDGEPFPPPVGSRRVAPSITCEARPDDPAARTADGFPIGSLDKEDIRKVVRQSGDVKRCYDSRMIAPPYPQGRVMIRIAIGPSGRVRQSCLVDAQIQDEIISQCIVERALSWLFPRPE